MEKTRQANIMRSRIIDFDDVEKAKDFGEPKQQIDVFRRQNEATEKIISFFEAQQFRRADLEEHRMMLKLRPNAHNMTPLSITSTNIKIHKETPLLRSTRATQWEGTFVVAFMQRDEKIETDK